MHEIGQNDQSRTERPLGDVDALLARNERLADQIKKVINRKPPEIESRQTMADEVRR